MNRFRKLIIVVLLALVGTLSAEGSKETKAIGMHFGTVSGNGYSYRYFKDNLGFQVTFGAYQIGDSSPSFRESIYSSESSNSVLVTKSGKKTLGSFGINGISVLTKTDLSRFYIHAGYSYLIDRTDRFTMEYSNDKSGYYNAGAKTKSVRNRDQWTVGIGPGLEIGENQNLRIAIELPITYNRSEELIMYIPQVGIYYYFK